jgi:assimilatory nitrate reductase catalytic subunit
VASTRGRDLDITGLSHAVIDANGPQQWPCRAGEAQGAARLYCDGMFQTESGRARFAAVAYAPVAERIDARYPFRLNTGRLRDQWHGMSRTGIVAALYAHAAEPAVELNPADLARRGLAAGDLVRVESRRGSVVLPVVANDAGPPGSAYLPMHWGSATLAGRDSSGINAVTSKTTCPVSKQPELKHAAVRIAKETLPYRFCAFGFPQASEGLVALRDALRAAVGELDFASIVLIGSEEAGVLVRAASARPVAPTIFAAIDHALGLAAPTCCATTIQDAASAGAFASRMAGCARFACPAKSLGNRGFASG